MPGTDTLVKAAAIALVAFIALLLIGGTVGGFIYGPRLAKALTEAAKGRADTAVAEGETDYQSTMADAQARTQAAEVAVTVQLQESTRELQQAPGADRLIDPDLYAAFKRGVLANRARTPPGGAGAAGADPAAGTAEAEG